VAKLLGDVKGLQIACVSTDFAPMTKTGEVWSFEDGPEQARLVWRRDIATWEHAASTVGRLPDGRMCLMSPTWGGITVVDARDGSDVMRFYWGHTAEKWGLRNYGPIRMADLDGDGREEFIILAQDIAQHVDVLAPWREGAEKHATQETRLPGPDVPHGTLVTSADTPLLWDRYYGTNYPTEEYVLSFPTMPIGDVDGDGKQEIVGTPGKEQWELKVWDGMTGAEKLSLPGLKAEGVFDLDGDGIAEIVARADRELVIGSLKGGAWVERLRLRDAQLAYSSQPVPNDRCEAQLRREPQPISVATGDGTAWAATQDTTGDGRADKLLLLEMRPGAPVGVTEIALDAGAGVRVVASSGRSLVTTTNDGMMRVVDTALRESAQWSVAMPVFTGAFVADINADGVNEMLVCRANGKVAALQPRRDGGAGFRELWSVDGGGFAAPTYPAPLICDLDGDGKQEVLVTGFVAGGERGVRLLDCNGKTLWETAIPADKATFGDFSGNGHLDVYLSATVKGDGIVGTGGQSFAVDGRNGQLLWRNDGSDPRITLHQMNASHRVPTVADVNGDGRDDVLFDAWDICVVLSGKDGSFVHEPVSANKVWQQMPGKDQHWTAYSSQIPLDLTGDGKEEILLAASWAQWGAWTFDRQLIWTWDPDPAQHAYRNPGIGDVDGDGKLELGVLHDGGFFRCYDAATGDLKWELAGVGGHVDVVAGDLDNDGRPEFLVGAIAIKAVSATEGKVLWDAGFAAAQAPILADINGDGLCEIIVVCQDAKTRAYAGR
jgi:hypothetical protein